MAWLRSLGGWIIDENETAMECFFFQFDWFAAFSTALSTTSELPKAEREMLQTNLLEDGGGQAGRLLVHAACECQCLPNSVRLPSSPLASVPFHLSRVRLYSRYKGPTFCFV
mmetsp:Transcript_24539/g.36017  ORF Transcript_24539/g.36017 Transcript_24539/m.36017 type:complete len:112 (-) Transcript_24539:521-856(-)